MPPLPAPAAPLADPVDPTSLTSVAALDADPLPVDPAALPYPNEGLVALLREVEL